MPMEPVAEKGESVRQALAGHASHPSLHKGHHGHNSSETRLTQSWAGSDWIQRGGSEPNLWPLSRSFTTAFDNDDDFNASRTFGGIERRPRNLRLPNAEERAVLSSFSQCYQAEHALKPHVVAFVNSRSGGQTGQLLMRTLTDSIGKQENDALAFTGEVCDLSLPEEPMRTIEALADVGAARCPQHRLLICGGDGTVTWILTALEQCKALEGKLHLLPVAIVPLGTGNDLARSLGWSHKLRSVSDILMYLQWVIQATPVLLDQWRLVIRPHEKLPDEHKLQTPGSHPQLVENREFSKKLLGDIADALEGEDPNASCEDIYVGFWQNYFSIGLDAKITNHVDLCRSRTACGQACFRRGCGKLCYAWQGVEHSCFSRLLTRSLQELRLAPEATDPSDGGPAAELLGIDPPLQRQRIQGGRGRIRQMMLVNINSYGAGLDVLPRKGSTDKQFTPNDGALEVFGVRNALTTLCVFARIAKPAYLASAGRVAFRLSKGECMQMDGEPWLLHVGCDVLVEPHRKLTMLLAPPDAPFWRGHISRRYWVAPESVSEYAQRAENQNAGR